jgi:acetyltransferase-like isoleucine patch superfamily enzyme
MFRLISIIIRRLSVANFFLHYQWKFNSLGKKSYIASPFRVDGARQIDVGHEVVMQKGAWLYCVGVDGIVPKLQLGKGCVFGYNNHIACVRDVVIGDHVLTANNVYISDNIHAYEDISRPIIQQPVLFKSSVSIGDGSWIGENVSIIASRVGKNCVIGANAVVTHDIPDFSVAVGIPAVVIRQYDQQLKKWHLVKK